MNNAHVWAEAINNTQIENAQRLIENAQALERGSSCKRGRYSGQRVDAGCLPNKKREREWGGEKGKGIDSFAFAN